MPFLDRDGCTLYYEMSPGPSRPVVLIHGWCCDHSYLAPQASHFAGRGHLVVSLDLRGHGRSGRPHQAYPIGGFADDVAWLCGALNLSKPILIGHSMGGIVAFDIAARYPDLPGAIAMLDSAIVLPEATRAAIPAFLERLRGPDYVATLRAYVKERLLLPTDDAVRSAAILEGMGEATQFVAAASFEGLGDYDFERCPRPREGSGALHRGRRTGSALRHGRSFRSPAWPAVWTDGRIGALLPARGARSGQCDDRPLCDARTAVARHAPHRIQEIFTVAPHRSRFV